MGPDKQQYSSPDSFDHLPDKPHVPQNCFIERIGSTTLVLHPDHPYWIELNTVGLEIYRLADGSRTPADIVSTISRRYEVSPERVAADVNRFFRRLAATGFGLSDGETRELQRPDNAATHYNLFLHLDRECNLTCPHCYALSRPGSNFRPDTKRIIGILDECAHLNFSSVTVSGGEPLMFPDIERVLRSAGDRFNVRLLTNGTLLFRDKVRLIVETCDSVQVSIDGSSAMIHDRIRGTGSLEKTMEGVARLKDEGFGKNLVFCTTVTRNNLSDIHELIDLAVKWEIPQIRFLPLMIHGRAPTWLQQLQPLDDELIALYESLLTRIDVIRGKTVVSGYLSGLLLRPMPAPADNQWCPVGRSLVMDFDGSVSPCVLMKDYGWGVGNLFTESVAAILERGALQRFGKTIRTRRNTIPRCRNCSWKNFCQAGCAGIALQQIGTIDEVDRFCDYRRQLYPRLFARLLENRRLTARGQR